MLWDKKDIVVFQEISTKEVAECHMIMFILVITDIIDEPLFACGSELLTKRALWNLHNVSSTSSTRKILMVFCYRVQVS